MTRRRTGGRLAGPAVLVALLIGLPPVAASPHDGAPAHRPAAGPADLIAAPAPAPAVALSAAPGVGARILHALAVHHVPSGVAFLPNLHGRETVRGQVVSSIFTEAPAPVGIATIGVDNTTGTPVPYGLATPSVAGALSLSNLSVFYLDNGAPDFLGAQLNAVLGNVTLFGGANYTFWTQNVVRYSDRTHLLEFVDNIWNFSDPAISLSPNAFYATGPGGVVVGTEFYYDVGPVLNVSMPFTVQLYLNASRTQVAGAPYDQVWFNYSVTRPSGPVASGSYDRVIFASQSVTGPPVPIPAPLYIVNGSTPTPTGYLPYDAEMVLSGPGAGSTTNVDAINGTIALRYLTVNGYRLPPTALNFGSDTGETVQGVAATYNRSHAIGLSAGPTFFTPFWNMSPTAQAGHLTIAGNVTPTEAFAFVAPSHQFSVATAAWAPVDPSGSFNWSLPAGPYEVELTLARHDPQRFAVFAGQPASWNISAALVANLSIGLSTPVFARSNAQLADWAVAGNGTPGAPYLLPTGPAVPVDPLFAGLNDFGYPAFPGLLLRGTTAATEADALPPFPVHYQGAALNLTRGLGLPATNDLQLQVDAASHVTLWNLTDPGGWLSPYLDGLPEADLMVWNSTSVLVGQNAFASRGASVLFYGGSGNVVWGNQFTEGPPVANGYNATVPLGLEIYESGDTVYDNAFNVTVPALSPAASPYTETLNGSTAASYRDAWNVSARPATQVAVVGGRALYGSIVGGTTQGGNYWTTYGDASNPLDRLPFDSGGAITGPGDFLPLFGDAQGGLKAGNLSFRALGLDPGTLWNVTVNGQLHATSGTVVRVPEIAGRYPFAVGPPAGFAATPAAGVVAVDGTTVEVNVSFDRIGGPFWNVTFLLLGLLGNATVVLNGTPRTGAGSVVFQEPNGSYAYSVDPVAGYDGPGPGTVVVAGATTVDLLFRAQPGWIDGRVVPGSASVTLGGIAVSLWYGRFNVSVAPGVVPLRASAPGYEPGALDVTVPPGATVALDLVLLPQNPTDPNRSYPVEFAENGLPLGTGWTVRVNGTPYATSGANLTVRLPSGRYPFTILPVANFTVREAPTGTGVVDVGPPGVERPLSFLAINGTLTIAPTPCTATVRVQGLGAVPGGCSRIFVAPPGSYVVSLEAPGFLPATRSVLLPSNASVPLVISLAPVPTGLPGGGAGPGTGLFVVLLVALGVVGLLLAGSIAWTYRKDRRTRTVR